MMFGSGHKALQGSLYYVLKHVNTFRVLLRFILTFATILPHAESDCILTSGESARIGTRSAVSHYGPFGLGEGRAGGGGSSPKKN